MSRLISTLTTLAAVLLVSSQPLLATDSKPRELRIITDRTEQTLQPYFDAFEKKYNLKVKAVFMDEGLVSRLETRPTEADLIITQDAELLSIAKQKKLLRPFNSKAIINEIPAEFRDPDNYFYVDAYRARVIFYSKDRVKPDELSTYEDLASPKWKNRICIRSGMHEYNLALFGQFQAAYGPEKSRRIIKGIQANMAREPKGNDREQAKAISEGKCDIALMNTYYHPIMAATPDQQPWSEATRVFFPDQRSKGTFIMRSGVALTRATDNDAAARQFLDFMASTEGQTRMVNKTYQYPVNKTVSWHPLTSKLGEGQKEVRNGVFKMDFVPLDAIVGKREEVIRYLNEIRFDKKP
ncbi:MAG: extracellular solute-binding protein [Deltaproteobacteria bacterium]|nr:extracellular solute-binding protein [Deltaproteobacteria bacterium]